MQRRNGGLGLALVVGTVALAVGTHNAFAQTTIFSSPSNAPVSSYSFNPPIVLKEEGSLNAGAQVLKNAGADGGEFHHDYLQANYGIPVNAHKNSLIMWHGCLGTAWERRLSGKAPGFKGLMLQRKWPVFVLDQPRISRGQRGLGGYGPAAPVTSGSECASFATFRYGEWFPPAPKNFFPGVQLSKDPASVAELCELSGSSSGPGFPFSNTDPLSQTIPPSNVQVVAGANLIDKKAGKSVIIDHSNGGQFGLLTAIRSDKVKGIVSFEGATFVFPASDPPPPIQTNDPSVAAINAPTLVADSQFKKLTKIPIIYYFGDFIEFNTPSPVFGVELWRVVTQRAKQFCQAVNSRGGDCEIVYLPKIGIKGNTHFPFADNNNDKVADLVDKWLRRKGLDGSGRHDDDDDRHGGGRH